MGYRDDRDAMAMQLADLERENARLRAALDTAEDRAKQAQERRQARDSQLNQDV